MKDFPILSREAVFRGFTVKPVASPTLATKFENGYVQTRQKFTGVPLSFSTLYAHLNDTDKDIMVEFEKDVGYATDVFHWRCPANHLTYEVRFSDVLKWTLEDKQKENYWTVSFSLIERRPNSSEYIS